MVDRIHQSIRGNLGELLPRIENPLPDQRVRLEEVSAGIQRIYRHFGREHDVQHDDELPTRRLASAIPSGGQDQYGTGVRLRQCT